MARSEPTAPRPSARALPPPTYAWDRLPHETPKAYAAFLRYRDLPPHAPEPEARRSLTNVARLLHVAVHALSPWSSAHAWVQRAAAWDMAQAQVRDQAHFDAIRTMSRRQAENAERTQYVLATVTQALARKLHRDLDGTLAELAALPTARLVRLVADVQRSVVPVATLERLARGADTARISLQEQDSLGLLDAIISDADTAALASALVARLIDGDGTRAGLPAPLDDAGE